MHFYSLLPRVARQGLDLSTCSTSGLSTMSHTNVSLDPQQQTSILEECVVGPRHMYDPTS
jgi:hypothetical protein